MKHILILLVTSLLFFSLSAQTTQEQADVIVIEHLSDITSDFTLYAKAEVQITFEIMTSSGETLELDYSCWVYYVNFSDERDGKYLIVKESNGNLLPHESSIHRIPLI